MCTKVQVTHFWKLLKSVPSAPMRRRKNIITIAIMGDSEEEEEDNEIEVTTR